jgi:hypothetical protein
VSELHEVHERLGQELRTVDPGPAPVDEAMRRGKAIRVRRRVAVVAGAAAVAAVVAGYPALSHLRALPAPQPVTHQRVVVTDVPPGPGSPPGLIAEGKIGNRTWQAIIEESPPAGGVPVNAANAAGDLCLYGRGTVFESGGSTADSCGPLTLPTGGDPVEFEGLGDGMTQLQIGAAAQDVTYVLVRLGDGQELKLIPVKRYGLRLVAFAAPVSPQVVSATAYLGNGQYRTAIAANLPGEMASFDTWLRPGEHGQPRVTGVIGSGTTDGHPWSVTAYEGPWGTCVTVLTGSGCVPSGTPEITSIEGGTEGPPQVQWGSAARSVSYVVITPTDGRAFRVGVVTVGDERLFAFALGNGQTLKRWAAYDAAGRMLASGGANSSGL